MVLSLCLVFIFGISLMMISIWLDPYDDARESLDAGYLEESLVLFSSMEQRFNSITVARQFFPEIYYNCIANQFSILYSLEQYDELLEKSATSPVLADVHFWTGNTLFRQAGSITDVQEQVAWLERAGEEFQNVIEIEPENWDAKFNFELTNRLIDELKEEKETPPQMLEILRPRPRQGEQKFQQTG